MSDKRSDYLIHESSRFKSTTAFSSSLGMLRVLTGATFVLAQIRLENRLESALLLNILLHKHEVMRRKIRVLL